MSSGIRRGRCSQTSRLGVEALEPRALLSADLTLLGGMVRVAEFSSSGFREAYRDTGPESAFEGLAGCGASFVPVANRGGPGTRDGHWRESIFGNELMTGFVGPGRDLPLSTVTIASLADLGYQVDLNAADPYRLG